MKIETFKAGDTETTKVEGVMELLWYALILFILTKGRPDLLDAITIWISAHT